MKKQDIKVALFIIGCVLLNYGGRTLSDNLSLPLWLDSIGTIAAAYTLGPFCGGVVGMALNCMYGAIDSGAFIYALTNGVVGVAAGVLCKKGMMDTRFKAFSLSMILALLATLVSLPINLIFYDGLTANIWGDAVIHYFEEKNLSVGISSFIGEFCVDLVDKLLSVIFVFFLVRIHENRVNKNNNTASEKTVGYKNNINGTLIFFALITASLLLINPQTVYAAEDDSTDFSDYTRTVYSSADGLVGEVTDISQTMDGMLWIGTYGGLYQYDGNRFVFMNSFDSVQNVNCLYTDEEGRLWIGTNDSGLSICTNNSIVNVIDETGGLSADSVRSITKNSEGLYFIGTTGALDIVKLSDGIHVTSVCEDMVYVKYLAAGQNGYVCAIDSDGELGLFLNEELVLKQTVGESGEKYTCCYFDDYGYLYTATADNKIQKCRINDGEIEIVKIYDCSELNLINSICLDSEGLLFVCSDSGIGYLDGRGKLHAINASEFDSSIDNMLIDYQGNYWFSSSRLGLLKLCKSSFEELFVKLGFEENVVNCVTKWNDMYVFGTDSGMDICDGELKEHAENDIEAMFEDVRIRHLITDEKGRLWVATSGKGIYVVNKDGSYMHYDSDDGLAANKARAFCLLSDGSMAVATDGGVSVFKNGQFTNYGSDEGFVTERTLCLMEADGKLYCGTDGGGIAVIDNGSVEKIIRRSDGLGSDIVLRMTMTSDGSGMFVITSNGLNYMDFDGNARKIKSFPYYNDFDVILASSGKVWVTSSAGIYVVSETALENDKIEDYELLDSKKGLRQGLVSNSWNYRDDDNLIICGDSGAVAINMNDYDDTYATYRIMLESIIVDGVILNVDKEETNTISRDTVRIEFIPEVINYSVNDPNVSIWLEGFESEPTIVAQSELENVVYTNLPSGNYVFHVAILDSMQEKTIEEVTYSFYKEKELYDNWWFNIYLFAVFAIIIVYLVWVLVGTQINKSLQIQRKEIENLKLKQDADAAYAAGQAKDRFLALMSHDIRTPINAILGMDEMILRESRDNDISGYAKDIKSAGDNLLSIVNSILDFSKIEQGKMEIVPVEYETKSLLKNLVNGVRLRAENKELEFRLDIDSSIPAVLYGDDVRISQVLSNLLTNSIKYTETGYVSFKVQTVKKDDGFVYIYFEVRDSGIGIRQEDMEKLFESFQRLDTKRNRNIEGTGLGMSIVSNLLALMGSQLKVESEYGKGSVFGFELKQKIVSDTLMGELNTDTDAGERMGQEKREEHIKAPGASVLAVDDSSLNIKVITSLLKINEIVPDTAESGQEAIKKVSQKHYDIIFLDHMMPEMDGIETFEAMREQKLIDGSTKVIVLTANAIVGAKEQYLKQGFDDYLAKPIDSKLLEKMIEKYVPDKMEKEDGYSDSEIIISEENSDDLTVSESDESAKLISCCKEIDIPTAMKYSCDSWEFFREIVKAVLDEYYYGDKAKQLDAYYRSKDYDNYRILVHTIKSTTLSIGAVNISASAKALETAAKESNYEYVDKNHEEFLKEFADMCKGLADFMKEGDGT